MKLTLTIKMPSYESARGCCSVLSNAGFNVIVSSPINDVFNVVINSRPEWVNQGDDMYTEVKLAEIMAADYLKTMEGM